MTRLGSVPQSLLPDGTTHWQAKIKVGPFPVSLGAATVTRTADQVEVHTSKGDVVITADAQHPGQVHISFGSSESHGTLSEEQNPEGLLVTTTDGKTIHIYQAGQNLAVKASGFSMIPSAAVITLQKA